MLWPLEETHRWKKVPIRQKAAQTTEGNSVRLPPFFVQKPNEPIALPGKWEKAAYLAATSWTWIVWCSKCRNEAQS